MKVRLNKKFKIFIFVTISVFLCTSLFFSSFFEDAFGLNQQSPTGDSGFRVVYADVGQGDMTLIETGAGDVILIDSSTKTEKTKVKNFLKYELLDNNKTIINYVIVTHPHEDHIGNMDLVFDLFDIEVCYLPNVSYTTDRANTPKRQDDPEINSRFNGFSKLYSTDIFKNLLIAVQNEEGCDARWYKQNEKLDLKSENTAFKFLSKPISENAPESDINNYSPIMLLNHHGRKFVFTGDATSKVEKRFLDNLDIADLNDIKNIDVYHAGHHGSDTSSSSKFLLALNPKAIVVSLAKDNSYNHPSPEFLQRVSENIPDANLLRTDEIGNIVCYFENGVLKIDNMQISFANHVEWWHVVIVSIFGLAVLLFWVDAVIIFKNKTKHNKKELKNTKSTFKYESCKYCKFKIKTGQKKCPKCKKMIKKK